MESGAISDGQITASSQWELDDNHAANHGRLHSQTAQWSAARKNVNQWLQVDLESDYAKVTRVATQGGDYKYWQQWVTKYKLQYSNDTVNFQYYKEPDKVKYLITSVRFSFISSSSTLTFLEIVSRGGSFCQHHP